MRGAAGRDASMATNDAARIAKKTSDLVAAHRQSARPSAFFSAAVIVPPAATISASRSSAICGTVTNCRDRRRGVVDLQLRHQEREPLLERLADRAARASAHAPTSAA